MKADESFQETTVLSFPSPLKRDLRAIYTLWLRDIIRLWRDKLRLIGSFVQPLLFLFILGGGLRGRVVPPGDGKMNYQSFIFPGILAMSILFTASFSGIAVVWDREVGFLKEVLVAPLSRTAIVIGKVLGGSTNSLIQASMLMGLTPFMGIHLSFGKTLMALGIMMMIGISQTAMGIALSVRMSSSQGFMVLLNFIILPLHSRTACREKSRHIAHTGAQLLSGSLTQGSVSDGMLPVPQPPATDTQESGRLAHPCSENEQKNVADWKKIPLFRPDRSPRQLYPLPAELPLRRFVTNGDKEAPFPGILSRKRGRPHLWIKA